MPMMTELSWLDTWLMLPANCLVIFRNGTTMLMPNAKAGQAEIGSVAEQQQTAHQRHADIQYVADIV